jgi:hypothetical protein
MLQLPRHLGRPGVYLTEAFVSEMLFYAIAYPEVEIQITQNDQFGKVEGTVTH